MSAIGIDFGTTTTVAAVANGGHATLVTDGQGECVLPSVVAFTPSGRVEVGRHAKARRVIDPANTLYSVKRILGKPWFSLEVTEFRRDYPFEFEQGSDKMPRFVTRNGKVSAVEAAGYLLAAVREMLPAAARGSPDVRFTVPASFDDDQRAATAAAAERAGFSDVKLLDEPHAAALAYQSHLADAKTVVVYDLGGGTFDLAVLTLDGGHATVRAAGGDPYLGGDDVDHKLASWATDRILETYRWDVRTNPQSRQALVFACERAKMRLSETTDTVIPLGQVDQVLDGKDLRIERGQVEALCAALVQRTFVVCDEVLARANVDAKAVDAVVLAGGGSYMPYVRQNVQHYFWCEPLTDLPPDQLVAMGAAVWTG